MSNRTAELLCLCVHQPPYAKCVFTVHESSVLFWQCFAFQMVWNSLTRTMNASETWKSNTDSMVEGGSYQFQMETELTYFTAGSGVTHCSELG